MTIVQCQQLECWFVNVTWIEHRIEYLKRDSWCLDYYTVHFTRTLFKRLNSVFYSGHIHDSWIQANQEIDCTSAWLFLNTYMLNYQTLAQWWQINLCIISDYVFIILIIYSWHIKSLIFPSNYTNTMRTGLKNHLFTHLYSLAHDSDGPVSSVHLSSGQGLHQLNHVGRRFRMAVFWPSHVLEEGHHCTFLVNLGPLIGKIQTQNYIIIYIGQATINYLVLCAMVLAYLCVIPKWLAICCIDSFLYLWVVYIV